VTLKNARLIAVILFCCTLAACESEAELPIASVEESEDLSGGINFTTTDFSENAFGVEGRNLTSIEEGQFVTGNSFFRSNWVTSPSSVETLDGLGPMMNAISCGSCHFKDGRAKPPSTLGGALNGLLLRLSIPGQNAHGGPVDEPVYGGQFQDRAILDVDAEGKISITYETINGQYQDGTPYSLRKPVYDFYDLNYGDLHTAFMFSPRIAQQIPGLGLLEAISEQNILSREDENDLNGDGISGRANWVWDESLQQIVLGRFGWKANMPSVRQQVAGAFSGDIGITTSLFPAQGLTPTQKELYPDLPHGGEPEITDENLNKISTYVKTLSVPARRDWKEKDILRGKLLFTSLNCSACHVPQMTTGNSNTISALNSQAIRPYTDLLLHDMGEDLSDGRPDFIATGSEWRTPPLWGLGMIEVVNGHTFLLHDGRARNIEEAILWHGGEAAQSKDAFIRLSKDDREKLLKFLKSL
jgi:CxxC motif-containing protein (DUF1111 family)